MESAKSANCSEIKILSAMQAECAKRGDENTISVLADLKWDFIKC
jgi:hypothetical protein